MKILIDATNIIQGGGVSHLTELLKVTTRKLLDDNSIEKLYIVGVDGILEKIADKDYIVKISMQSMQSNFIKRFWWKYTNFNEIGKKYGIDIIFNPGGSFYSKTIPYVTMCRNMLVFETEEANRFGYTLYRIKFVLLRLFQIISMKNAKGVIFISNYAQEYLAKNYKNIKINKSTIIYHGISKRFNNENLVVSPLSSYSEVNPFNILYVSNTDPYKHHSNVAKAIIYLQDKGYPINYTVVGGKGKSHNKFENVIKGRDNINYVGKVPFEKIQDIYKNADLFVFASTCENMPNILIEAMTTSLPIACSDKEPMPEFLKEGGVYFNSNNIDSIHKAIEKYMLNENLRREKGKIVKDLTLDFSWEKCAKETYSFIKNCYDD